MIDSVTTEEPLTPVTESRRSVDAQRPSPTNVGAADGDRTSASLLGYAFERSIPGDVEASRILRTPQATSASDTGPARRASTDTAPGALTLVGSVTDASGAAVPAAVVALIGTNDTTVTDDSGRFVLHGAALWRLHAERPPTWASNRSVWRSASPLNVQAGSR